LCCSTIIEIFHALGLCEENDRAAYRAVVEMAEATGDTPFNVDRTFWLIGSGKFFHHDNKKSKGISKKEFINIAIMINAEEA